MKTKFLWMALLCAFAMPTLAQTEKGGGLIGANFSVGTSKETRDASALNNFSFTPRFGYFLNDNLLIGLEIPLNLSKLESISYIDWNGETGAYETMVAPREFSFGLSPFVRKYFEFKNRFKIFAQANFLFQINSTKLIDEDGYLADTDNKLKGIGASLRPGVSYTISKDVTLEFSFPVVTYFHQNYRDEDSKYNYKKTNNLILALDNFTPHLGVNLSIP